MIPVNSCPGQSEASPPAEHHRLWQRVRLDLPGLECLRLWRAGGSTLSGRAPIHELALRLAQLQ
jgi:hypothetical protein